MISPYTIKYLNSLKPPVRIKGRLKEILNDSKSKYIIRIRRMATLFRIETDTGHIEHIYNPYFKE